MRKSISIITLFVMFFVLALCMNATTETFDSGDFKFEINEDGETVSLTKYLGSGGDVSVPETVEYEEKVYTVSGIENEAFLDCTDLAAVTLHDSILFIGDSSFAGCSGLTSIELPYNLLLIGESAFSGCTGLTSIEIPAYVTAIGAGAFSDCSNLTAAYFCGDVPSVWGESVFSGTSSDFKICYIADTSGWTAPIWTAPDGSEYKTATMIQVEDFMFEINADGETLTLKEYIGYGFEAEVPTAVKYNETTYIVTHIGESAFLFCKDIESVVLSDEIIYVGDFAFAHCSNLKAVYFIGKVPEFWGTSVFADNDPDFKIYYIDGIPGWSTPTWTAPDGVTYKTSVLTSRGTFINGDFKYEIHWDGKTVSVKEYLGSGGNVTVPATVTNSGWVYTVTEIGDYAFWECHNLESVKLPEGLTSIGEGSFYYCLGLKSITLPEGLTSIGEVAFWGCENLTSLTFPDSLISVDGHAFNGCTGLKSITFNEGLTSIGYNAFASCYGLTSITLPESLTSIGSYAFGGCTNLKVAIFKGNVPTTWGGSVFDINENFRIFYNGVKDGWTTPTWVDPRYEYKVYQTVPIVIDGTFSSGDFNLKINEDGETVSVIGYHGGNSYVTVPETFIGNHISGGITESANVELVEKEYRVTQIGDEAFADIIHLVSIILPESITCVGDRAFADCPNLSAVYFNGNAPETWGNAVFANHHNSFSIHCYDGKEGWTIPSLICPDGSEYPIVCICSDGTIIAGYYKFEIIKGSSFDTVGVVKYLGNDENVTVPVWVQLLGHSYYVSRIGDEAFRGCSDMKSITLPEGVNIGNYAFYECLSLTSITLKGGSSIGDYAFSYCKSLTSLTLPDTLTSIGDFAFAYCENLTAFTFPKAVTSIGDRAFGDCSSLTAVYFYGDVPATWGKSVFVNNSTDFIIYYEDGKSGWTTSTWTAVDGSVYKTEFFIVEFSWGDFRLKLNKDGETVTLIRYLGRDASVMVPKTLEYREKSYTVNGIGDEAFEYCYTLKTITLPDGLTSIGNKAFYGCLYLNSVYFYGDVPTTWGESVFARNSADFIIYYADDKAGWISPTWTAADGRVYNTHPFVLENEFTLGYYTYKINGDGTTLTVVKYLGIDSEATVPANFEYLGYSYTVNRIGDRAFADCECLTSITLPDSIISIGDKAFEGCSNLTAAYFSGNAPEIWGDTVFVNIGDAFSIHYYEGKEGWTTPTFIATDGSKYEALCICSDGTFIKGDFRFEINRSKGILQLDKYLGVSGDVTVPEIAIYGGKSYVLTEIGDSAFSECSEVTSILLPEEITSIEGYAFSKCTGLTSITLPVGLKYIGYRAFSNCSNLSIAYFKGDVPSSWGYHVFDNNSADFTIYAHEGKKGWDVSTWWAPDGLKYQTVIIGFDGIFSRYDCKFRINEDFDTVTLFCYLGSDIVVTVPETVRFFEEEYTVTKIENEAFSGCTRLAEITFPESLTSIGDYAFSGCTSLYKITFPESLTAIGCRAFADCLNLAGVYFNGDVPEIWGDAVFVNTNDIFSIYYYEGKEGWSQPTFVAADGTEYESVCICLDETFIKGDYKYKLADSGFYVTVFKYLGNDCDIVLPKSVVFGSRSCSVLGIENEAFFGCETLKSITVNESVSIIGDYAFADCVNLSVAYFKGIVPSTWGTSVFVNNSDDFCIYYHSGKRGWTGGTWKASDGTVYSSSYIETDGTITRGDFRFKINGDGKSVTLVRCFDNGESVAVPKTMEFVGTTYDVTQIGNNAFFYNSGLKKITVHEGITSIGNSVFGASLEVAYFEGGVPATWGNSVFDDKGDGFKIFFIEGKQGWTTPVWMSPDGKNYNTVAVDLNGYYTLGDYKLKINEDNETATIVKYLGSGGDVTVPETVTLDKTYTVTQIRDEAFSDCSGLTSVTLPESINYIGNFAFKDCSNLSAAYFNGDVPETWGTSVFHNNKSGFMIYYYFTSFGWTAPTWTAADGSVYDTDVFFDENEFTLGNYTYRLNTDGKTLTVVKYIGKESVAEIPSTVSLGGKTYAVTQIGTEAFAYCRYLASVRLPDGIISIGDSAFRYCSALEFAYFCGDVPETWGESVFAYNKQGFMIYYLCGKQGWTSPTWKAADGSVYNTDVILEGDEFTLGDFIYKINTDSETLTVLKYVGSESVAEISSTVSLGRKTYTVTQIGDEAFTGCTSLTEITLPDGITSIGDFAFAGCSSLNFAYFYGDVPEDWGEAVFANNSDDFTIYYIDGKTGWSFSIWTSPDGVNYKTESFDTDGSFTNEDYKFKVNEDEESVTLIKYLGNGGDVTVPVIVNFCRKSYTVTQIGNEAFAGCESLTSITLHDGIISVGDSAFADCSNLSAAYFKGDVPETWGDSVFVNSKADFLIYYIYGKQGWTYPTWEAADGSVYNTDFILDGDGFTLGDYTYKINEDGETLTVLKYTGNESIAEIPKTVEFSEKSYTVTKIEKGAFANCSRLTEIILPDSLTSIGDKAFANCLNLTAAFFDGDVPETWGNDVFVNNKSGFVIVYVDGKQGWAYPTWRASDGNVYNTSTIFDGNEFILRDYKYKINEDGETLTVLEYVGNEIVLVIPETVSLGRYTYSVTQIGYKAFDHCIKVTEITLPDSVTSIENEAFFSCIGLSKITLSKGLTSIGDAAFYMCKSLTEISFPEGLTHIGISAFSRCANLTKITLPESLTSIGNDVFSDCTGLTEITLPNNLTSIGKDSFSSCTGLVEITLPDSLIFIGEWAFSNCTGLTEITLPNSLTSVGAFAFSDCENLSIAHFNGDVPTTWGGLVFLHTNSDFKISFIYGKQGWNYPTWVAPDGSRYNTLSTFDGNEFILDGYTYEINKDGKKLTVLRYSGNESVVEIPETVDFCGKKYTVTAIGNEAFANYNSLTEVTLSDSLISIGDNAFANCSNLKVAYFNGDVPVTWGDSIFVNNKSGFVISYIYGKQGWTSPTWRASDGSVYNTEFIFTGDEFVLGDFTYKIDSDGTSLTVLKYLGDESTVAIPETVSFGKKDYAVTKIGDEAFANCFSLTEISLPDSLTSIGDRAFSFCVGLIGISLPEGLTSIGEEAFSHCVSFTEITLPDSVTSIGDGAFSYCNCLSAISLSANLTIIGDNAFEYCAVLTEITLPDSVTAIGDEAFSNCSNLSAAYFNGDVPATWGNSVFAKNKSGFVIYYVYGKSGWASPTWTAADNRVYNTEALITSGKFTSGDFTFEINEDGKTLTVVKYEGRKSTVEVPATASFCGKDFAVTKIGDEAFASNSKLRGITLPDSVTYIGNSVFYGCAELQEITLPHGLTSVGDDVFAGCYGLKKVYLPDTLVSIGNSAFSDCWSLTEIILPDSLTSIGDSAFSYCIALTEITVPDSVTSIGSNAFKECINLKVAYFKGDVPETWSVAAFANVSWYFKISYIYGKQGWTYYTWTAPDGSSYNTSPVLVGNEFTLGDYRYSINEGGETLTVLKYWGNANIVEIPESFEFLGTTYSVIEIGDEAFADCISLTEITLHESITSVGDRAFADCSNLEIAYFKGNVPETWGEKVFADCSSDFAISYIYERSTWTYPTWTAPDGSIYNTSPVLAGNEFTLGDYIYEINEDGETLTVLKYLGNADVVEIPESFEFLGTTYSVIEIGEEAFADCISLTETTLHEGITSVGDRAFADCSNLEIAYFKGNVPETWGAEVFVRNSSKFVISYIYGKSSWTYPTWRAPDGSIYNTELVLSGNEFTLGDYTYKINVDEETLTVLNYVGNENAVEIPETVSLGEYTYSVTKIGKEAFVGCTSLTEITLHEGIMSVGDRAFADCSNLTAAYFNGDVPEIWGDSVFEFTGSDFKVYYTEGKAGWSDSDTWIAPDGSVYNTETFTNVELGDVSGDGIINLDDVIMLLRHVSKAVEITDSDALAASDVTGDGKLNLEDVVKLLRYVSKAIPSLK